MLQNISEQILIVLLLFLPLERLFPLKGKKDLLRQDWAIDAKYLLLNSIPTTACFLLALNAALVFPGAFISDEMSVALQGIPFFIEIILAFLLADFVYYVNHRLLHRIPALWKFHRIHHSVKELDALAAHRVHPIDQLLEGGVPVIVLITCGFSSEAIGVHLLVYRFHALFIHSSINGPRGGWLKNCISLQRFHHWHHADDPDAYGKNFAGYFPFIDRLFNTLYLPGDEIPETYGVREDLPETYIGQLMDPFISNTKPQKKHSTIKTT